MKIKAFAFFISIDKNDSPTSKNNVLNFFFFFLVSIVLRGIPPDIVQYAFHQSSTLFRKNHFYPLPTFPSLSLRVYISADAHTCNEYPIVFCDIQ